MNETHERTNENKSLPLQKAEKHGQEKTQELSQHVEKIKVQAGELLGNTREKAQDVIAQTRDYIKANPKKSAGIAIGALVVASALTTHRKKVSHGGSKAFMALLASPLIASWLKNKKQD